MSCDKSILKEKINTEYFIKTVEKYPEVWNTKHRHYQNGKRRELAWEKICATVIPDYVVRKDQYKICFDLKKKWTHIRDYCRRRVQGKKSKGDLIKRKYIYDHLLEFLKPIFKPGQNVQSNEPDAYVTDGDSGDQFHDSIPSSPEPSPILSPKRIKREHNYSDVDYILADFSPQQIPITVSPVPEASVSDHKDINVSDVKDVGVSSAANPLPLEPQAETEDGDEDDTKFLLSFRRYMRKMNDEQKVEFQIGMLKLVKKTLWEVS